MATIRPGSVTEEYERDVDIQTTRIFYWILAAVLIGGYVLALISDPSLRELPRVVYFSLLMALHLVLYWGSLLVRDQYPQWLIPYIILQTLLITLIVFVTSGLWFLLGLYIMLSGQSVGILEKLRPSILAIIGIVLTSVLSFALINGLANLVGFLAIILPLTLFVGVYVVLYGLQNKSKTEAMRLLRDLETAHQQLAEYVERVEVLTIMAERQRLARELHDSLVQGLTGLVLQLEAVDSHLARNAPDKAQEITQRAMGSVRVTLSDVRQAIGDLRLPPLSASKLEEALRTEVENFTTATAIPCEIKIDLPESITDTHAENTMRVVSEGLRNAARHANASKIAVILEETGNCLELTVADDGIGFNPGEAGRRPGHFGLIGLRELARLANGTLEIRSFLGEGTSLIMRLPLENDGNG